MCPDRRNDRDPGSNGSNVIMMVTMVTDRRNDRDPGSNGSNVKQCVQIDAMIETLVVMVVMLNNVSRQTQ